ncbi:hypothetical protein Syun_000709 [Stephania yunnanensis]|uniref:Uncharacterized protein n=1 Tax=Stephania yunnanensis TaxID=152371 RepID=A0AAP0LGG7_9MAGN
MFATTAVLVAATRPLGLPSPYAGDWSLGSPKPSPLFAAKGSVSYSQKRSRKEMPCSGSEAERIALDDHPDFESEGLQGAKILEEEKVHQFPTIGEYPLYIIPLDEDVLSFELDLAYRESRVGGDTSSLWHIAKAIHKLEVFGPSDAVDFVQQHLKDFSGFDVSEIANLGYGAKLQSGCQELTQTTPTSRWMMRRCTTRWPVTVPKDVSTVSGCYGERREDT